MYQNYFKMILFFQKKEKKKHAEKHSKFDKITSKNISF